MPPLELLLGFTIAAFLLILVPGPQVLFVITRALAYGRRVALVTAAGGAAGSFLLAAAVAVGVGAIVATSATAYTVIRLAGAAYLIHLGVRTLRQRRSLHTALAARSAPVSDRRSWWEGFVVGVTNPKTAVFLAAVLPQFIDRAAGHASAQMLVLGGVFAMIALGLDAGYGAMAGTVRAWFSRSARRLEVIGGTAGLTMIGLGLGLALQGRKD